jgi:O-methyltransferase
MLRSDLMQKYINLLKKSLIGELYIENEYRIISAMSFLLNNSMFRNPKLTYRDLYAVKRDDPLFQVLQRAKAEGQALMFLRPNSDGSTTPVPEMRNYTELSHTMIGMKRLDNIQHCIETVLDENVEGDIIETGVWRGGATIFMRGLLAAYGISDRVVWVADSFQGVPPPSRPQDANFDLSARIFPFLAVSQQAVAELVEKYGLLDEQVKFLAGWFKDTLPTAPISALAVLRLDGDLYESTMDALNPLYPKLAKGGFIIVDDYYSCPPCKQAIDDFRATQAIADEMFKIDEQSVFWRKR